MTPPTQTAAVQSHEIVSIRGADEYELNCRYWRAVRPVALVVVVHGVISHSLWAESVSLLLAEKNISVLAMDRRGCGLNTESRGDAPCAEALLEDLHAVLTYSLEQPLPIHVCGFCWGCNYLMNYLPSCNLPITTAIFIAPSVFASEFTKQQPFITGNSSQASEEPVTPIDQFTDGPMFESFIKPDPLRLRKVSPRFNQCIVQFAHGLWMKFLKLQLPCLMMLADRDTVVDNQATEQAFHRLKTHGKSLYTLAGSHGIQFDQPEKIADHIQQWINQS